ncbi:hypothetical protein JCM16163A_41050 [Paenibacillus sp. YK5]
MARQGQKLTDELKEQIRAHLVLTDNLRETARKFGVSPNTVRNIKLERPDEFAQLRTDKKQELIDKLWDNIVEAQDLGFQMIAEAKKGKRDIPLGQISTYLGTLYDKRALMMGESTNNTQIKVTLEGELDTWAN